MLVAVAGLSAAGKTTAVEHLQSLGVGEVLYVGRLIHEAILELGLPLTPENERRVREDLRREHGPDVFAARAMAALHRAAQTGTPLIDAICMQQEAERYRSELGSELVILAIEADFKVRAERAAVRREKPLSHEELAARDALECDTFHLLDVMAGADYRLVNNGRLEDFKAALDSIAGGWPLVCSRAQR